VTGQGIHFTPRAHPCLTPLYFLGFCEAGRTGIYRKFILEEYGLSRMNARNWLREFHPGSSYSDFGGSDSPNVVGILEAEPPQLPDMDLATDRANEVDELFSRPEWHLAQRVAASKGFSRSELLSHFLLYVCEHRLRDKQNEITEQKIGIHIFNRPADYNPGEDNIVRSYARLLRKRLDAYFAGEGADEPIRLTVPRGGYVPIFQSNPSVVIPPQPPLTLSRWSEYPGLLETPRLYSEDTAAPAFESHDKLHRPASRIRRFSRPVWLSGLAGIVIGLFIAWTTSFSLNAFQVRREQEPAHAIWVQLFRPNRNTLIVPSDSGLGILQNLSGHLVNVEDYASGAYLSEMHFPSELDPRNFNDLRRERYTSVVSLNITSRLKSLPEVTANRTQIRYARGITAEDLKNSNVVLIGSKHTNPWVSLFEKRLNFRLEYTPEVDESYVLNEHPSGPEQTVYRNNTAAGSNHTYGAVAYLPSLDGAGHVLIIQGLNMAATQAAGDLLFNDGAIKPVLRQATLPDGSLRPFELLIETSSVGATAPGAQLVATRIYP
jgi:hypothetical protein